MQNVDKETISDDFLAVIDGLQINNNYSRKIKGYSNSVFKWTKKITHTIKEGKADIMIIK